MKRPNDITTKIADIMNDETCKICRKLNGLSFKETVVVNCRWMLASDIKVGCYQDIPEEVFFKINCNNTWFGNYIIDRLIDRLAENGINLYLVSPEYYTVKSDEAIKKSNYVVYTNGDLFKALCDHNDKNNGESMLMTYDDDYVCTICGERGTFNRPPMNCKACEKFGSCGKSFELRGREYKVFRKGWRTALHVKGSEYTDEKYGKMLKYCDEDDEIVTRQNSIIIVLNKKVKGDKIDE